MGQMAKIIITAKENPGKFFEAAINPTKYSVGYKNDYNTDTPQGSPEGSVKFEKAAASTFDLEFLLDGTGVNKGTGLLGSFGKKSVMDQFDLFVNVTGSYVGGIHKPYDLTIVWGSLLFEGVLVESTVDFTLFSPDGSPLRGIIKAKFKATKDIKLINLHAGKQSPDLTHKISVKAGDKLPLMSQNVYGDSKYYLEVAKVNGIINFRQLEPGQIVYFPPLQKQL